MRFSSAVQRLASVLVLACLLLGAVGALADDADTKMQPPIPAAPAAPLTATKMMPPIPAVPPEPLTATLVAKVLYLVIATRLGLPVR